MSNEDISVKFAIRIVKLRKERNLSQDELALLCGIDKGYIGRIEHLKKTSLVIVDKIAKGLNIELKKLLVLDI